MTINLGKGEKVDLHKDNPNFTLAHLTLGWAAAKAPGVTFDVDLSAILLDANDMPAYGDNENSLIYYNHKENNNKSVYVLADNRTGGTGDLEQGFIKFPDVPQEIKKIIVVASIFEAVEKRQNFGQINNAYLDIYDATNQSAKKKLVHCDLTEDMSSGTGAIVGRFMREANGSWSFKPLTETVKGGMAEAIRQFGLTA